MNSNGNLVWLFGFRDVIGMALEKTRATCSYEQQSENHNRTIQKGRNV